MGEDGKRGPRGDAGSIGPPGPPGETVSPSRIFTVRSCVIYLMYSFLTRNYTLQTRQTKAFFSLL